MLTWKLPALTRGTAFARRNHTDTKRGGGGGTAGRVPQLAGCESSVLVSPDRPDHHLDPPLCRGSTGHGA